MGPITTARAVAAAILPCALVLAGCSVLEPLENCSEDTDCPRGQRCHPEERFCEEAPVVIGASLSLSGELGEIGREMATGLALLEHIVNENGGVAGRPLHIEVLDDETRVDRAQENVRQFVDARVAGIVGPMTSDQVLATEDITHRAAVVQVTPTAGAPELSTAQPEHDRYLFRTISTIRSGSAAAIALFALEGPPDGAACERMAIVHSDDAIGVAYLETVEELFENGGGCVVARIAIPSAELIEYDAQVTDLLAARPDCATLVAFPEAGVEIMGELERRARGSTSHDWSRFFWIGTSSLRSPALLEASSLHPEDPAEGLYGGDEDSTPLTREYNELEQAYNDFFQRAAGTDLPVFVSNTYDAAMLLALAVEHAGGPTDPLRIRDGLWAVSGIDGSRRVVGPSDHADAVVALQRGDAIHYKGASSRLVFDAQGTVSSPTVVWKIEDGAFEIVQRYPEASVEAIGVAANVSLDICE